MIIDFTIKNYLSIKDEVSLSFLANNIKVNQDICTIPIDNGKFNLYSFSAIYGPNASGKSNLIKALSDLINFILFSHRLDLDAPIPVYKPFRLDKESINSNSVFEIEFIANNIRYQYELEFNNKRVIKEDLYFYPEGRKATLFKRDLNDKVKFGNYFTGEKKSLETFLLPNKLLLSLAANSKNKLLQPVFKFFRDTINLHVRMDSSQKPFHSTTFELRDKGDDFKKLLFKILKAADLNVSDVMLIEDNDLDEKLRIPENMPDEIRKQILDDFRYLPQIGHAVYSNGLETNEIEYFDLEEEESTGTIKMYDIAGEVINTLLKGSVLIIDEFNSGLHPLLNKFLVELFIDPDINKKNAQLLISTHDTCVLDLKKLKREQIWFTNKSKEGITDLYSLDEFDKNSVRDFSKYSKNYLDGRFEAIPAINIKDLTEGFFSA